SGLRLPSSVLRFACRWYFSRPSSFGMLLLPIWCPIAHSAAASFAWLFETHSSGRTGSPIVAGSSSRRRSSSSVGSVTVSACLPLPGRRTTPDSAPGSSRSFRPRPIVLRAIPVARAAALIPPCPAVRASAATNSRRPRSSRLRRTAAYRSPIADASTIGGVYAVINRAGIAYSRPRHPIRGLLGVALGHRERLIAQHNSVPSQLDFLQFTLRGIESARIDLAKRLAL